MQHEVKRAPYVATTAMWLAICAILLLIGMFPYMGVLDGILWFIAAIITFPFLFIGGIGVVASPFIVLLMRNVTCPYCGYDETAIPKRGGYNCGKCHKRVLIMDEHGSSVTKKTD